VFDLKANSRAAVGQPNPISEKVYSGQANDVALALVPPAAKRVLDVGCGAGMNALQLKQRGMTVEGVTASEDEATLARKNCRNVYVHDLERGLPDLAKGVYDCVVCSHVLEHICFPTRMLRDIRLVMKSDGKLVVALPNLLFYKNRFKLFAGEFEYQPAGLMDETHFRWYTFKTAQRLLETHGFAKVTAIADGSCPLSVFRRLLPSRVTVSIDGAAARAFPGIFGYQMVFVYEKRVDKDMETGSM
jgi:2-polyprenyl-3-methyl-5-hydroxy-6-metoxy-1,4-benzoquinol methylase